MLAAHAHARPEPDVRAAVETLRSDNSPGAERAAAAQALVAAGDSALTEISALLTLPITPASPAQAVVTAISGMSWPPPALFPLLSARLETAGKDELAPLMGAVGSFRTRAAAQLLLKYALADGPSPASAAAFAALARLSGHDDFGADATRWTSWINDAAALSDSQWDHDILLATVQRADRLAQQRRSDVARLTDTLRKLHLATAPEARSSLLAQWLSDPIPEVRDLGFELVSRELADTGTLGDEVGAAALKLLNSPVSAVRAQAAVLTRQLAPDGAEQAVLEAITREQDPAAASGLLLAVARWPGTASAPYVLEWLDRPGVARAPAMEAALKISRKGSFSPPQRAQLLRTLRAMPPSELSPSACLLIGDLGDDSDLERLLPLLHSPTASIRSAAGESLLAIPRHLPAILEAARLNPDLFPIAARAALVDSPTAETFAIVASLPSVTPESARASLLILAAGLPATDLLAAIQACTDPILKSSLIPLLASENRVLSEGSNEANLRAIGEGVQMLVDAELSRGDATAALAAIDNAPFLSQVAPPEKVAALRCCALVALGQLDDALRAGSGVKAWLRGLDLCRGTAYSLRVIETIEARFSDILTPEDQQALATAKQLAVTAQGEFVGPPSR